MVSTNEYDVQARIERTIELMREKYSPEDALRIITLSLFAPDDEEYINYRDYYLKCKEKAKKELIKSEKELIL